jgi:hypothetical protein
MDPEAAQRELRTQDEEGRIYKKTIKRMLTLPPDAVIREALAEVVLQLAYERILFGVITKE